MGELIRDGKVSSVGYVEDFTANLEPDPFTQGDVLNDRRVPIKITWTINEIAFHGSCLSRRHVKEDLTLKCLWSCGGIKTERSQSCGGTGCSRRDDAVRTLRKIDVDDRWVDVKDSASGPKDAYEVLHFVL